MTLLRQPAAVSASSSTQWAVPMLEGLVWSVGGSFASALQPFCWMMQNEAPVKGKNPIYPQQSNTVSDQEPPIQNVSMNSMNNDLIYMLSLSCYKNKWQHRFHGQGAGVFSVFWRSRPLSLKTVSCENRCLGGYLVKQRGGQYMG